MSKVQLPEATRKLIERRQYLASLEGFAVMERVCFSSNSGVETLPPGTYTGRTDMVLAEGMFWEVADKSFSLKHGAVKHCFANCQSLMRKRGLKAGWTYVEGLAQCSVGLPLFHSWLVDTEGNVIDPTWKSGSMYLGVPIQWSLVQKLSTPENCTVLDRMEDGYRFFGTAEHRAPREVLVEKRWAEPIRQYQDLFRPWDENNLNETARRFKGAA